MRKTVLKTNKNHPAIRAYSKAIERGMKSQHVIPNGNGWVVKKAGANKTTKTFKFQKEAEQYANQLAQSQKSSVFIYGKDGRISDRKDY
ncbi:DUF2188 domain-containing protein [Candidatus Dojkabacteria bacterium]|nr:DUF2188 domain-containing protein [Candidatus Dojkabacteria bacterium]